MTETLSNKITAETAIQADSLRRYCTAELPLDARLEHWMTDWLNTDRTSGIVDRFGSPVNVICTEPMDRNIKGLFDVANDRQVDFQVFFARKSNKCLSFVDQANESGIGIDTASENEISQCLDRGFDPAKLICTAAVKSEALIRLCLANRICIAVDNRDELEIISSIAKSNDGKAVIALRLGGFEHHGRKLQTRFGFDVDRDRNLMDRLGRLPVQILGIHFHLDGYDASQRVSAMGQSIDWVNDLRTRGHRPRFIDMGGGFPISYLNHASQWHDFWREHRRALLNQRDSLTYRKHSLGLQVTGDRVSGTPNLYPYYQTATRGEWFASVLDSRINGETVADQLRHFEVQLRCEPGRSLLDGCGLTVARVEFRKQNADGDWLIGLSMNRTQCRTSSDEFLVDPLLVPSSDQSAESMSGYLVGAYCTESELISLRRLRFPCGVRRGDRIVFPNTAGYLMHFLESRSHQFPLAKNVVVKTDRSQIEELDAIDW